MNKIDSQLASLKASRRLGLMTHLVVGYPTLELTVEMALIMAKHGVAMIELQIPFSDPLADGSTIMRACERSLSNGTKVKDAFTVAKRLQQQISIPLLFMAYFNTLFCYGVEQFCKDAAEAGISGLIVPDVPLEVESTEQFLNFCQQANLYAIRVISPASSFERLRLNAAFAQGFVYVAARQSITGAQKDLPVDLSTYLKRVQKIFTVPTAVGFGISTPEHLAALQGQAAMAVIGSAIIDAMNERPDPRIGLTKFLKSLMRES